MKNLITLANGLMNEVERPGVRFDMSLYSDPAFEHAPECGTVGCAVGHAPFYGIEKFASESWLEYMRREFIDHMHHEAAQWCFGGSWSNVDNSKRGAAQRIIYLLQYRLPENWDEQMHGYARLCYTHIDGFCEYWLKENAV